MTYDSNFYDRNYKFQKALSDVLTPWIIENLKPKSVIDFGCGCGYFLQSICENNIGLNFNKPHNLMIPELNFIQHDLSEYFDSNHIKFDLVISLEVAEHLHPSSADMFIESLTDAAEDYILFSAATPGQGGDGHLNECPHSYWHHKFAEKGFIAHDIIRPILKDHKEVPFWYRNNIFFYRMV